jgi:ferrochelatase
MAHGTPESVDQMAEYLTVVRGGRRPSPELVEEMRHNYAAIGGRSPLTELTEAQGAALQSRLGTGIPVAVGMRNWRPYIKDAIETLTTRGADRIIGIPLAPQFSTLSVQKYADAAAAATPQGVRFDTIRPFHSHALLLDAFADRVRAAQRQADERVVFTAHSLPKRVIDAGDPYPGEVEATARGVADRAGIKEYDVAFQSAGRTPEPWLGPALDDLIAERAAAGTKRFLVVPVGFVCDHTEILFDIDVQAAGAARKAGAALRRTESLNTSPTFIALLEDLVRRTLNPEP